MLRTRYLGQIKTDSPKITKSMNIAGNDLNLDHLYLIFPGNKSFPLSESITAYGLDLLKDITL